MRSADEEIWNSCVRGYKHPTKIVDEETVLKLTSELSKKEKAELQANNRALDILSGAVDVIEHRKIENCEIAKEVWDILVTCHEGTYVVKQSKLQRLTTEFEMIRMEEEETFNQFYSKLISIVNSCKTLGEPIPPFRVIKKILRSLPDRFKIKVTMLERKRKLSEKSVEEIVGLLQTYEADMMQSESHKSKIKHSTKSIAFKSSEIDERDSICNNDDEYDTKAMDLFFQSFKKFFKKKAIKINSKIRKDNETDKKDFSNGKGINGGKGSLLEPKCQECHGYGHLAHECINVGTKKKDKFQGHYITWDDSHSDSSEVEQEDKANFTSFVASLHSQIDDKSINKFYQGSSDDSENEDGGEFDDEDDLRESYDRLYRKSVLRLWMTC
ncbi:hypothetical protein RHMOL_Rhmol08G0219400 [Rhododendron molle]|uniref:Uncharacterized protein n=1 Tax=Rhododendron molle TaxID=49168 RepID=A0ACC0MQX2_RHOML|nr:hypothetical protein RHMOL_Rhmol08G0219400 [Rhododendron molle]